MAKKARKYAKKQTKASKTGLTKQKASFWDNVPSNRAEYLQLLIKLTLRALGRFPTDKTMAAQAERLKAELATLS